MNSKKDGAERSHSGPNLKFLIPKNLHPADRQAVVQTWCRPRSNKSHRELQMVQTLKALCRLDEK